MEEIIVFTDGSCIGNGKAVSFAGYGIHYPNKEHPDVGRAFTRGPLTNQRAELYAIYKALKTTTQEDYAKIKLYSDSNYSMKCLTEWAPNWENNGWINSKKKPVKNQDIIKPLYKLYKKHKTRIVFFHVKAHTNRVDFYSRGNAEADKLAVQGSEQRLPARQKKTKTKSKNKNRVIKIDKKSKLTDSSEKKSPEKTDVKIKSRSKKKKKIVIGKK